MRKVARVVDRFVSPERHIEIAALVEATEAIETRPVQIVEQLRAFLRVRIAASNQSIKTIALAIEKLLVVAHPHTHSQTILHVTIEVDQVRVDVVQQRLFGLESQHNSKPAAKRFDRPTLRVD